ncbi:MAG: ArsR/SmtB family transcription factor [Gemmatimonadales bacterium]
MIDIIPLLDALADPTRCRLLLALEEQELTVGELKSALQLPQSTVSRHLKVLADEGWVTHRAEGVSNWYRAAWDLPDEARGLWAVVRSSVAETASARQDAKRIREVVAARHHRTREFFATSAGQWDRLRGDLFGDGLEWQALAGLLDPRWVVADLGSGTGQLAAMIAPFVRRVIAVDESPAMLDAASRRIAALANAECRPGALEALPIETASVDLAFAILVLHHLPEPVRAVTEAARILKPGGRLVVVDMLPHDRREYRETMGHQWLGFDADTLGGWFRSAGLSAPSCRPLAPKPDAQGPLLFVASATRDH